MGGVGVGRMKIWAAQCWVDGCPQFPPPETLSLDEVQLCTWREDGRLEQAALQTSLWGAHWKVLGCSPGTGGWQLLHLNLFNHRFFLKYPTVPETGYARSYCNGLSLSGGRKYPPEVLECQCVHTFRCNFWQKSVSGEPPESPVTEHVHPPSLLSVYAKHMQQRTARNFHLDIDCWIQVMYVLLKKPMKTSDSTHRSGDTATYKSFQWHTVIIYNAQLKYIVPLC